MVEQLICNQQVGGSSPFASSSFSLLIKRKSGALLWRFSLADGPALLDLCFSQNLGEVPEWPKGTDCKSVGSAFGGSNPPLPILNFEVGRTCGNSSVG